MIFSINRTSTATVLTLGSALLLLAVFFGINRSAALPYHSADLLFLAGLQKSDDPSARFDKIRELVNAHTVHRIQGDMPLPDAATAVYRYADGDVNNAPGLTAALRAQLMQTLLTKAGDKSRLVTLFANNGDSHTVIEIYNRRTRHWELQDPDYNVFFVFRASIQRAGLRDLLTQDLGSFIPCQMGEFCSWRGSSPEGLGAQALAPYFTAARTEDGALSASARRFDRAAFCAARPALCKDKIRLYE